MLISCKGSSSRILFCSGRENNRDCFCRTAVRIVHPPEVINFSSTPVLMRCFSGGRGLANSARKFRRARSSAFLDCARRMKLSTSSERNRSISSVFVTEPRCPASPFCEAALKNETHLTSCLARHQHNGRFSISVLYGQTKINNALQLIMDVEWLVYP